MQHSTGSLNDQSSETAQGAGQEVLRDLGWSAFYAAQLSGAEAEGPLRVSRVMAVHRNSIETKSGTGEQRLAFVEGITIGDWIVETPDGEVRILDRKSLFKRKAPGSAREMQLIAANVDTVFVVTSCNHDFNLARLERFCALAFEAQVRPVIILTKPDICEDPSVFEDQARSIRADVPVFVLNAKQGPVVHTLAPWCTRGQTVAFLGSSGVGKSTLVNALSGAGTGPGAIETQAVRAIDSKGRHTTTSRQLYLLEGGYAVMDTPGMRELQMMESQAGLAALFADLHDLSAQCKFNDCTHDTEPGCAIRAALEAGSISSDRLARWRKLLLEDAENTASLAERRRRRSSEEGSGRGRAKGKGRGKTRGRGALRKGPGMSGKRR